MIEEKEIEYQDEKNIIILCTNFDYQNGIRQVSAAIINYDQRKFQITEFQDSEHFSNFESLLVQTNPQDQQTKFVLYINYPDLQTEKEKIQDIIGQCDIQSIQEREKKYFLEKNYTEDINKLLKKSLQQHIQESTLTSALQCLNCAVLDQQLSKDQSNFKQFTLEKFVLNKFMKLDLAAINALLIFPKQQDQYRKSLMGGAEQSFQTLVDLLDKCKTQIGSRLLRRWIRQPLQDEEEINKRLDIVEYLIQKNDLRNYLQTDFLRKIADLDKLYVKFYKVASNKKHNCNLSDCIKVYSLVENMNLLYQYLENQENTQISENQLLNPLFELQNQFNKLQSMIKQSIDLEKAKSQNEYMVNPMFSPALTEISKKMKTIQSEINSLKQEYARELGVEIKIVDSNTHTYLFEGKKKETDDAFRRKNHQKYKIISMKKTTILYTTEDLQSLVAEYNCISDEYTQEQKQVVDKILAVVSSYYPAMENASSYISQLDVLSTFAQLVVNSPTKYTKPDIQVQNNRINLVQCRHPCLEVVDNNCVPNDCYMDKEKSRFHIITGPNMGGKSTYIRQVALCVLLAHVGCYIPAEKAEMPVIDAIITRVGASDMQIRGISTFMSEMLEASCMLKTASEKSLIIIDELGRGTATNEGFGLAWAISEYIVEKIQGFCLFATHFHEMTKMGKEMKGVVNYYVDCVAVNNKLTMQYRVKEGFA
ncbi:hypothetical protein IMG5_138850, partial [Ichthyophthirius multifiliis]